MFLKPNIEKLKAKKDIAGLAKAMGKYKDDINQILYIIESIAELGAASSALQYVTILVNSPDLGMSIQAIETLKKIMIVIKNSKETSNHALFVLINLLKKLETDGHDAEIIAKTRMTLKELGYIGAVDALMNRLNGDNEKLREKSIEALGNMEYTKAIEHITPFLTEKNEVIRKKAETALKNLGWKEGQDPAIPPG
jgi:hypothetical protein